VQLLANGLGLMATICLAPFLILRYQLIGACYATSIAYFIQALVLIIAFMHQNNFRLKEIFRFRNELNLLKKDS
jgi:Na+-driven multidrug efflux pump